MSSVYPGSLDSFTAKTDGVDYNLAAHINDLQDAVVAIETELGLDPAGSEADVKTRLDNMTVDVGAIIHAATDKATPVDADELGLWDSVASALKKLTWANLKARLKTHFDTLYLSLSGGTVTGALNLGGNAIVSHTAVILTDRHYWKRHLYEHLVLCYGRELYADMLLWSDGKPENMPVEFREYFDWDLVSRLIEKYIER